MGLFPNEQVMEGSRSKDAAQRMFWTRELGTRKLLIGFVLLIAVWFAYGKVKDHFLLQTVWPQLEPKTSGLSVVGTLDMRSDYDRNMFRIVQANKMARVELTDFGWRTIFNNSSGELFSETVGNLIQRAISLDSDAGYAMLTPFLHATMARQLGNKTESAKITKDLPLMVKEQHGMTETEVQTTLGALLDKYSRHGGGGQEAITKDAPELGSGSGHDVEHGMTIPGNTLALSCPLVLQSKHFTDAWMEENPPNMLQGKTFKVHLDLTPEGRSRFYQWSHDHANESLAFVLDGQVVAAGRIRETLDVDTWEVGPLQDEAAARQLEKSLKASPKG